MDVAAPARHDPYAALRIKDFRFFIVGYSLAVIGSQMLTTTIMWKVYEQTGSPWDLMKIALIQVAPVIFLSLIAGQIADRFNRKTVLLITQVILTLCPIGIAMIALTQSVGDKVSIGTYILLGINQVALTFGRPVRSALMPALVPHALFGNAVTWNSTCFEISAMFGPAIAGGVIALTNPAGALFISGAAMGICFVLTLFLPNRSPERTREPVSVQSLLAGVRFVFSNSMLLAAMSLDLFAVLLGGCVSLLPIFCKDILHVGEVGYGFLMSAPALGAVCTALILAHRPPMKRPGRAMLLAVGAFGAATIVFGLSKSYPLSLAMMFLLGAFDNISVIVRHTLVQVLTPDSVRGRVTAVNQIFIGSSNELGKAESTIVAGLFGAVFSAVSGGIGTILVVIIIAIATKSVRRLGRLDELKPLDFTPEQANV